MSDNKANHSETRREDWGTPRGLFDRLDSVFDFAADLCANTHNARAKLFIDEHTDVNSEAAAFVVENFIAPDRYMWINPPYKSHGGTGKYVGRAVELAGPRGLVCLIPVSAGSKWWEVNVWPWFDAFIWPRRFPFEGAGQNAKFDCAICVRWSLEDCKDNRRIARLTKDLISLGIGPVTVRAK